MAESNPRSMALAAFLKEQEVSGLVATVEAIPEKPKFVKVTPWVQSAGCLCRYAVDVPEGSIKSVTPTGQTHPCCGKVLKVVEVQFQDDATLKTSDVFGQLMKAASGGGHEGHAEPHGMAPQFSGAAFAAPMSSMLAARSDFSPDQASIVCPFGYLACRGRCGERCYSPSRGETCFDGQVCSFGRLQCGCSCYSPSQGETCHRGVGQMATSPFSERGGPHPQAHCIPAPWCPTRWMEWDTRTGEMRCSNCGIG